MNDSKRKLMILTYHRVIEDQDWNDPNEIDLDQFRLHVAVLARYFNVVPLADGVQMLRDRSLPRRAVAITFDDGYRDNVTAALPVLQEFRVPATFFIATGFINGGIMWNDIVIESVKRSELRSVDLKDFGLDELTLGTNEQKRSVIAGLIGKLKYLQQEERDDAVMKINERFESELPRDLMMDSGHVLALRDAGMEVGGHTRNHPILKVVPDAVARAEIESGKADLEKILGHAIHSFAYPNGRPDQDYDLRHCEMVQGAGFSQAVTTAAGCASRDSDLFQLGRMSVWHRSKPKLLLRMMLNYFEPPAGVACRNRPVTE